MGWLRLLLLAVMVIWLGMGIGSAVAQSTGPFAALEAELGRDPAAVLAELAQRRQAAAADPALLAELHLLAGEAQLLLTRGREALAEADAGLAALARLTPAGGADPIGVKPDSGMVANLVGAGPALPVTALSVRLQLLRAAALDYQGQPGKALASLVPLFEQLEHDQPATDQRGQAAGSDPQLLVEALTVRGTARLTLNETAAALADLQRAYRLASEDHPRVARGDVAGAIANLYAQQGDNDNGLRYYREAIRYFQQISADVKLSIAVYSIGTLYRDMQNWPEARRHFGWSLQLSRERGDHQGVAYAQQQLAHIAIETGQLTDAKQLLDAAEPLFAQADDFAMVINTLISRADLAGVQKQYDQAMQFLARAEALAKQYELNWMEPQVWDRRADLYAEQGKYAEAYSAYRIFHQQHEAAFRRESDQQVQELRVRFDSERQEQQNALLQQQNALQEAALQQQRQRLWLYFATAMLSLLSTVFLLYVIYKDRQVRRKLDALAHTDELTGLANRRQLMQDAQLEVERARRYDFPLCLAALDLDHFKAINDQFGHASGDEVLRRFAQICRQSLRQTDVIGRTGGEEFVLLLPHTALVIAKQIVERLRRDFRDSDWSQFGNKLQPTVSIGLTEICRQDSSLAELLRRADDALYVAKQRGRDQIVVRDVVDGASAAATGSPLYEKY